jgi:Outer membrane protein beta-barrel domain
LERSDKVVVPAAGEGNHAFAVLKRGYDGRTSRPRSSAATLNNQNAILYSGAAFKLASICGGFLSFGQRLSCWHRQPLTGTKGMKNKIGTLLLGALVVVSAPWAQAQSQTTGGMKFYAQPSVIVAFPGSDFDAAVGGAIALGVDLNPTNSFELEVTHFQTQATNFSWAKFEFTPVMLGYKYRVPLTRNLSWQVGASVGAMFEKASIAYYYWGFSGNQTALAGALQTGIAYAFSENVSLDLGAKVQYSSNTDITTSGNMAMITLGLKCRF